jgi:hypothetical protein
MWFDSIAEVALVCTVAYFEFRHYVARRKREKGAR